MSAALVPEVAEARDHVRGAGEPTLLVFGDYECPYTRLAYRSVQGLEADGVPLRFAFAIPACGDPSARAGGGGSERGGGRTGAFLAYARRPLQAPEGARVGDLERYADEIGLDIERFTHELEAHVHLDRVEADRSSALASGAAGTPTIFLDGLPYLGSYERAELRRALSSSGEEKE